MSRRALGLTWAAGCSPAIGWAAAWYGNLTTHGRLGTSGALALLAVLPGALAGAGNVLLGRSAAEVLRAGIVGAASCLVGFVLFVVAFFLTVPPEFFT